MRRREGREGWRFFPPRSVDLEEDEGEEGDYRRSIRGVDGGDRSVPLSRLPVLTIVHASKPIEKV